MANWGTQAEREQVKSVYPYLSWKLKVDKMSDPQVIALFLKFKEKGKIK